MQNIPVKPPYIFLAALLVMIGLHRWWPLVTVVEWPWTWLGVALMGVACGVWGAAFWKFISHRTPIFPGHRPRRLVDSGIYGLTRNPMYLGIVVCAAGFWIILGTLTPALGVLGVAVGLDAYIRWEERWLDHHVGAPYREYRQRVRRWL